MQSLAHVSGLKKTAKKGRAFTTEGGSHMEFTELIEALKNAQPESLFWIIFWPVLFAGFLLTVFITERRGGRGQTDFIGNERSRWKA